MRKSKATTAPKTPKAAAAPRPQRSGAVVSVRKLVGNPDWKHEAVLTLATKDGGTYDVGVLVGEGVTYRHDKAHAEAVAAGCDITLDEIIAAALSA